MRIPSTMNKIDGSTADPSQAAEQLAEGLDKCHELVSHLRFTLTSLDEPFLLSGVDKEAEGGSD